MRLYEIFNRPTYTNHRSEEIVNLNNFKEKLETECSEILSSKRKIFRGVRHLNGSFLYVEPKKHKRKSANTFNYTTLIIDNSLRWIDFPNRSQSIICSTDSFTARAYGNGYCVLPVNGSRIGVCSTQDFWFSFPELYNKYSMRISNFNDELSAIYKQIFNQILNDDDIYEFKTQLANLTQFLTTNEFSTMDIHYNSSTLHGMLMDLRGKDLYKKFDEIFDPWVNNFDLMNTANFNVSTSVEVWTDGPAYLVSFDAYEKMFGFNNGQ